MLEVQRNLVRVSVLANQRVQRIAVGHLQTKRSVIPIAKNTKIKQKLTQPIKPELGDSGTTAYLAIDKSLVAVLGVEFSNMFTSPKSCMTRSSCRKSSWPFSRYP